MQRSKTKAFLLALKPGFLGVGGVNSSARTVDWSLISRDEGDIGLYSPTVKFKARAAQVESIPFLVEIV